MKEFYKKDNGDLYYKAVNTDAEERAARADGYVSDAELYPAKQPALDPEFRLDVDKEEVKREVAPREVAVEFKKEKK